MIVLLRPGSRVRVLCLAILLAAFGCGDSGSRRDGAKAMHHGGDVFAAGERVHLSDSVPGDAMIAGGEISFSGMTGGDYLGAGGEQRVTGRVGGDVRAAGGEVRLDAEVGRNATIAGGQVTLRDGTVIGRNAYLAGSTVRVDGAVQGSLRVMAEEASLDGAVGQDVSVEASRLVIGPNARIGGALRYRVPPEQVEIDPGASIAGERVALPPRERRGGDVGVGLGALRVFWLLGFLVAGLVTVALLPGVADAAAAALRRRPGAALGIGFLWVIAVPIAATLVALTVVGIPLAMIIGALYMISLYLSGAVFAVWLGRLLLRSRVGSGRRGAVLAFLAGGVLLAVVGVVPILGMLVMLAAMLLGLGGLGLALRARMRREPAAG